MFLFMFRPIIKWKQRDKTKARDWRTVRLSAHTTIATNIDLTINTRDEEMYTRDSRQDNWLTHTHMSVFVCERERERDEQEKW